MLTTETQRSRRILFSFVRSGDGDRTKSSAFMEQLQHLWAMWFFSGTGNQHCLEEAVALGLSVPPDKPKIYTFSVPSVPLW